MALRTPTATCIWVSCDAEADKQLLINQGHALNKILKDIINRYNVVRGRKVQYVCSTVRLAHMQLHSRLGLSRSPHRA